MDSIRHNLLRLSLIGIFGLAALSIAGAFLGAERATLFFNSLPMILVWIFLFVLLAAGLFAFPSIRRRPASFAMHLGCVLVIAGAMWGSPAARQVRAIWRPDAPPADGFMLLKPGETSDRLTDGTLSAARGKLPFSLRLDEFHIEHYPLDGDPWSLNAGITVPGRGGVDWLVQPLAWTDGNWLDLPQCDIRARLVARENSSTPGASPVFRVELARGTDTVHRAIGGDPMRSFHQLPLAPLFPEAAYANRSISLLVSRAEPKVKDYISRVTVIRDGQPAGQHAIEVNHPLHVAGYHIYQHSCDHKGQTYTILHAVADDGLFLVYAGFLLLGVGVCIHFWLLPMFPARGGAA